jgi:transcription elongation GreA/GreB family factor
MKPMYIKIGDVLKINLYFVDEEIENLIIKLVDFKEEKNIDDPEEISVDTPLGNALLNRQIIDEITYETNGNRVKVSVIEKLN